jgi:hypothetical protein
MSPSIDSPGSFHREAARAKMLTLCPAEIEGADDRLPEIACAAGHQNVHLAQQVAERLHAT